jgi:two-component system, OmpR family, phosphate regulon sensor histidine kinase PhoR
MVRRGANFNPICEKLQQSRKDSIWYSPTETAIKPETVKENRKPLEKNAAQFIDALPDGALIINTDSTIVALNAAALDVLPSAAEGIAATTIIRNQGFAATLAQVRETGTANSVEIEFHGRPPRMVNAHVALLQDSGLVLVLLRDLTREQAVEKMRSDFVANASHEMRTPLATIIGSIETLQGAAKDDAKAREKFLATMLTQAHRMKRLIDDLLTLSRIELNEHVQPEGKVQLSAIIKQARANLTGLATHSKIDVALDLDEAALVTGNADELLQVALNLIENAIKYGGDGGRVLIACKVQGTSGVLSVQDFGQGIAEDHIPRLTERFYRVSTKESRARGGTGLGLAIVKHIILRHRGQLSIQSAPGRGSTFTVSVPLYISTR